jgi:hypothetical protein
MNRRESAQSSPPFRRDVALRLAGSLSNRSAGQTGMVFDEKVKRIDGLVMGG